MSDPATTRPATRMFTLARVAPLTYLRRAAVYRAIGHRELPCLDLAELEARQRGRVSPRSRQALSPLLNGECPRTLAFARSLNLVGQACS